MKQRRATYRLGARLEGTVERLVPGGAGLLRGPKGVVFVELAAPGDRVTVEVDSLRAGVPRASIVEILDPGPGRVEAPCPWYGRCGGCEWQHLDYSAQIDAKRGIVVDAFTRIGGIDLAAEIEVFPAPRPFGSRARIELHADPDTRQIGFYERRSRRVVPFGSCLVCREEIDHAIESIRNNGRDLPDGIHILGGAGEVRSYPPIEPIPGGAFWLPVGEFDYLVDPGSFFQSSLDLLPLLVERVTESLPSGGLLAWDLYCGAGLFSLPLARRFRAVVGVDVDPRTIVNAGKSAERNEMPNVSFATGDVMEWLARREQRAMRPDLVVVDPPRTGLSRSLAELLASGAFARLTYVSCDPATLARDTRILTLGALRLADVALFDIFPQTHHVETVVRFAAE